MKEHVYPELAAERAKRNGPKYRDWNVANPMDRKKLEESVRLFLEGIGEDLDRSDLIDTPKRVADMWMETLNGHFIQPEDYLVQFENTSDYRGPIILEDAELYSMCAHHLQPFIGTVDIAYAPRGKIIGLSKLVRIARVYAKRLQVQESLTKEIADALNGLLDPEWVMVRYRAEHYCMRQRGVRIKGSQTTTMYGHGQHPNFNQIFTAK